MDGKLIYYHANSCEKSHLLKLKISESYLFLFLQMTTLPHSTSTPTNKVHMVPDDFVSMLSLRVRPLLASAHMGTPSNL